jgi:IS5 family transposase
VRSERMLMEQMEYNLLFRWFVGLSANEPVWHPTVFTKNRDRLPEGAVAEELFSLIVRHGAGSNVRDPYNGPYAASRPTASTELGAVGGAP